VPRTHYPTYARHAAGSRAISEKLRRKHEHYASTTAVSGRSRRALPGAFLEFVEAADPDTLARALASAPEPILDPNRVYMEVELT
jgi:hypothetical protein